MRYVTLRAIFALFPSRVPNPYLDDDAQREARSDIQLPTTSRRAVIIMLLGGGALLAFGVLALIGMPGTGIALVPFGVLMMLLGGIELLLSRLG